MKKILIESKNTIENGYSGCRRKDFENKSRDELIDILVDICNIEAIEMSDWRGSGFPVDQIADALRRY